MEAERLSREIEIIRCCRDGYSNDQIAQTLHISLSTVTRTDVTASGDVTLSSGWTTMCKNAPF